MSHEEQIKAMQRYWKPYSPLPPEGRPKTKEPPANPPNMGSGAIPKRVLKAVDHDHGRAVGQMVADAWPTIALEFTPDDDLDAAYSALRAFHRWHMKRQHEYLDSPLYEECCEVIYRSLNAGPPEGGEG